MVEEDPPNMPEPMDKPAINTEFVDADHASNVVTSRSQTGILIFINHDLIM